MLADLFRAKPANQRQASGFVVRIENIAQPQEIIALERWPTFQTDRIFDAARIFDMRVIMLTRSVANPEHVSGSRVPVSRGRIDASQSFFKTEKQRFVARVELCRPQLRMAFEIQATGL